MVLRLGLDAGSLGLSTDARAVGLWYNGIGLGRLHGAGQVGDGPVAASGRDGRVLEKGGGRL